MTNRKSQTQVTERSLVITQGLSFIQQGEQLLVDARLLHKQLKSKQEFANWIKARIRDYGFKENEDFLINLSSKQKGRGGHNAIEYHLTLDTAKELAMLERNEIGRAIRKFFIAKEKELRGISQLPKEPSLFKGLKPRKINDRTLYPYREILSRCGYSINSSGHRRQKYWMHFIKDGGVNFITEEYALHLYHSRQVYNNRKAMINAQPVLPFNFGDSSLLNQQGGNYGN